MPRRFSLAGFAGLAVILISQTPLRASQKTDEKQPEIKGQRIFVCGHSFHVMIPGPLNDMAKLADIKGHKILDTQFLGGSRVLQHWNLPDEKNRAKKALRTGEVDILTLAPHLMLPDEGIDNFTELLLANNAAGKVYVQASWFPHDLPGKNNQNFKNDDRDMAKIDDLRKGAEPFYSKIVDQLRTLNKKWEAKHKRQVVFLVPVGQAVLALREKIVQGKAPGITKQSELFTDPIGHARPPVAVLAAYCYYAAIYQRSPVGLGLPSALKKSAAKTVDALNRMLQEIAWETVTAEALSGVRK